MKAAKKRRGPLLSIDLGSHSIKFAVGQYGGDRLKVTSLFTEEIPEGVYSNGEIKDELALKTAIQSAIKNNHIKIKDTVVTIECTEIIKREMLIQQVPEEDRLDLIAYEVSQYLPIDVSSYVLQYKDLGESIEGDVKKSKILLGAMPKDIVKSHFDLLIDCGLTPVYMDMHSNSLDKLVRVCHKSETGFMNATNAYIDFGNKIVDISIFENYNYKFNRLLKLGSSEFDRILRDYLSIDPKEAENRKKKTSVVGLQKAYATIGDTSNQEDVDGEVKNLVVKETIQYLDDCIEEINKVFKYYTSRSADNKIDSVYLYGGGAQFTDIAELFSERLELPTKVLSKIDNVDFNMKMVPDKLTGYVNALGALIRG